jgi:hypothetical protein
LPTAGDDVPLRPPCPLKGKLTKKPLNKNKNKNPTWQVDLEGHIAHRYGNDKTRAELKSRLLQHDYSALMIEAGEVNKSMKEAIFSVIGSRGVVDETDIEV